MKKLLPLSLAITCLLSSSAMALTVNVYNNTGQNNPNYSAEKPAPVKFGAQFKSDMSYCDEYGHCSRKGVHKEQVNIGNQYTYIYKNKDAEQKSKGLGPSLVIKNNGNKKKDYIFNDVEATYNCHIYRTYKHNNSYRWSLQCDEVTMNNQEIFAKLRFK
ncbi:hypothetical protein [Piscirickettsia litoralis]|uniref:Uncharacterized protein n=1 Tax=Piscirickettsia litoralis TaxID=1891921 RepID=A0ABX2ZWI5_9GAMM|nr:hypothetical protein [Piscirickettsia litoralis]ODN40946.1 hypothetical protein BGC07_18970 [Piscirickettsia litoralis]